MGTFQMNRKTRFESYGMSSIPVYVLSFLIFFISFLSGPGTGYAKTVEFVTKEAFAVEKNAYKAYPFKVLFQKLHDSDAAEKRKIRNVIILKQVFEQPLRQRAEAAGAAYEKYYGVVKELNGENLRLWVPETDGFKDFYVGIDRIPLENKFAYDISASNIGKYAAVAYVLDNRIYKLEISFALTPPTKLYLKRRGAKNLVEWREPDTMVKPSGYRVFVNGKFYKMVDRTAVEVPRSGEQADEFYVKAVYPHQNGLIDSEASPILYDETSAKEIQQKQLARKTYEQIITALNTSQWQDAKKRLTDNRDLLIEHLNPELRNRVQTLAGFFRDLDEGDRLTGIQPQTLKNLSAALSFFRRAEKKAKSLPENMGVKFIAQRKITENADLTADLKNRERKLQAERIVKRIAAALNTKQWQNAKKLLYDNQAFLAKYLDSEHQASITVLEGFFRDLNEGDRLAGIQPLTRQNLDAALNVYQRAREKAKSLPADMDAGFIAQLKINETAGRKKMLEAGRQKEMAGQTYDRIIAALTPEKWVSAEKLLKAQYAFLAAHLDPERKSAMAALLGFFREIAAGDRLAGKTPASPEHLAAALERYRRAAEKAGALPPEMDAEFIAQLKISEISRRKTLLEGKQQKQIAEKAYAQVVAALTPAEWEKAKKRLYDNQMLILDHLDRERKKDALGLIEFFRDVDEGDRLIHRKPETAKDFEMALTFYRRAVQKAKALSDGLAVAFIADKKISDAQARLDEMGKRRQQQVAGKTYDRVIGALTPADWQTARTLLLDNRELLLAHLDPERRAGIVGLVQFFRDIEKGDRILAGKPDTDESLNEALSFYQQAGQKAAAISGLADLSFITELKTGEINRRKAQLERKRQQLLAEKIYDEIIKSLTPSEWETAGARLTENEELLTMNLDAERKSHITRLIAFFQTIDEGDRLTGKQPETRENLEMALSSYRLAEQKIQALSDIVNLSFITEMKINANHERQAVLESKRKQELASKTFDQVTAALNPSGWKTAQKLALEKLKLLTDYLDSDRQETAVLLIDFFRDIEEGEQLSLQRPETEENYNGALTLFQQAEEKAISLSGRMDVMFIPELMINTINTRKAELAERQQALAAAQQVRTEPEPPPPAPAKIEKPEPFDDTVDPKTALNLAIKNFDGRKYDLSLKYFMKVYGKQINNLKKGGKKQIFGLLALPPKVRAEIIFLVQWNLLKEKNGNDEDLIREGLMDMQDDIEGSTGLWSIITERKKNKIRRHIERF